MSVARLDRIQLYYQCLGDGPDVVFIHGLAANHAFWPLTVLLALRRHYRITLYDLRGHGHSEMPPSGYTSAHMADDLHALLDHLDIPRAHLIGHSFGGVVALHFAALHPDRTASLVLADSRIRALQPVQRMRDWPDWKAVTRELKSLGLQVPDEETEVGLWLLDRLTSPGWRRDWSGKINRTLFVPFGTWDRKNRSVERWLRLAATTTAKQDVSDAAGLTVERIRGVRQPALAVYGEKSRAMESCRGLTKALGDCRAVIVPGAGHFHPVTRPAVLLTHIEEFLPGAADPGPATR